MLPKFYRLTYNNFRENSQKCYVYHSVFFQFFLKISNYTNSRFVIIVPKSIDKQSSARHRMKRVIIEIIRSRLNNIRKNLDILIKVKRKFNNNEEKMICDNISFLIDKINSIRPVPTGLRDVSRTYADPPTNRKRSSL